MRPPRLRLEDLEDDERLADILDDVVLGDRRLRRHRRWILRRQERLQQLVSEEAWRAYLRVEEVTNARTNDELLSIARWAFAEGQRAGRRGQRVLTFRVSLDPLPCLYSMGASHPRGHRHEDNQAVPSRRRRR